MLIKETIQEKAYELGITFCEFVPADITFSAEKIQDWYSQGYAAEMKWLEQNIDKRTQPSLVLDGAKTIIVCGLNYWQIKPERQGSIATYALGRDYHKVLGNKLKTLCNFIEDLGERTKYYVDTGPVLERPIAELAGIGWQGKSSLLVTKQYGTFFFLGEIFTTLPIECKSEKHTNFCGSCSKCMLACPTGAIVTAGKVDANKCISYLTIEHKGAIPLEYRKLIGGRLYGCDECNAACPWNKVAKTTSEQDFTPRNYPSARDILYMTSEEFSTTFAGSPIHRIKLERLQRNACIVLGNIGNKNDIDALQHAVKSDNEIISEAAQWAIGEL